MKHPPVSNKRDFVRRYESGEFGNQAPTWNNIADFLDSGPHHGLFHVRNRIAGADTWYNVQAEDVPGVWERACTFYGYKPADLYISAMAPTERTLIQGEVQQGTNGLEFYYSTVAKPMREALACESMQVSGTIAVLLLTKYLCPNSYEWLQILLERYPNHVIELSAYECSWGTLPGFNTVFWEVRRY